MSLAPARQWDPDFHESSHLVTTAINGYNTILARGSHEKPRIEGFTGFQSPGERPYRAKGTAAVVCDERQTAQIGFLVLEPLDGTGSDEDYDPSKLVLPYDLPAEQRKALVPRRKYAIDSGAEFVFPVGTLGSPTGDFSKGELCFATISLEQLTVVDGEAPRVVKVRDFGMAPDSFRYSINHSGFEHYLVLIGLNDAAVRERTPHAIFFNPAAFQGTIYRTLRQVIGFCQMEADNPAYEAFMRATEKQ